MLEEYISQAEENGYIVSKNYYNALIDNEEDRINTLKQEQSALLKARDEAVANDEFDKYSEDWYRMCEDIDSVTQAIEAAETATIKWGNEIRNIDWEIFDLMQQRISDITDESEFLIELMSNKKLFDDKGNFTAQGVATTALLAQNYNTNMYQADLAGEEAAKLKQQLENNPYDTTLEEQYRERIAQQREYILAAEDAKNAIVDLVENGIELELEALDEQIQKYQDALSAQKDLYEYSKKVEKQTAEISNLQKQLSSLQGDDSEESKKRIQELKVSLEEAESDLQETEYDKYIADQSALLDNLYTEYELLLNERLDNTDNLIQQVIDGINTAASLSSEQSASLLAALGDEGTLASALGVEGAIASAIVNAVGENGSIKSILNKEVTAVGTTLSSKMNEIWTTEGTGTNAVLAIYGQGFQDKQTTTNNVLNGIKISVDNMVASLNKEATKKTTANKTSSSSIKNPTTNTTNNNKSNTDKKENNSKNLTSDQLTGIAASIWIDGSNSGWGNNPLRSQRLIDKFGEDTAKKIQNIINAQGASGGLYNFWKKNNFNLDKYKYNAFKLGARKIDESQLAWTQEQGQEYIVRPSDGAILTPVAKGDSILTSAATNNLWNMANTPSEFIRDNLSLGTTSVPNNSTVQNGYNQTIENVIFSMPNVRNYDEMLTQMQRDPNFERLITSMSIDRLAGKSSLTKGKAIR